MPSSHTRRKINELRELGKRMAAARWKLDRQRRDVEMTGRTRELAEIESQNLPRKPGDPIGCLQWMDFRTGKVARRIVEIGDRADRIVVRNPDGTRSRSHGWTWFLTHFRKAVCQHKI